MNRYPVPYSQFVLNNFILVDHRCAENCTCRKLGCTEHWAYSGGNAPNKGQMNKMLATWQAFRNKPGCQAAFLSNFGAIAALVKPLSNVTVSCDLDSGHVAEVYDKVRAMLCNSVVCTTKALHFFAPDLFIILDRMQVFSKWRRETQAAGNPLGGLIDGIDGARYTLFMNAVVKKLSGCFVEQLPVVLDGRSCGAISNVDQLRWCSPMMVASSGTSFPNTIGKALDNMIRSNDET